MASESVFPVREEVEREVSSAAVSLDDAGDVVSALTSETARRLVALVYDDPATASDLADAVDTSLQNVQYHLDRLVEAGVVEVVATWYSERGGDMDVYGASNEPLVIVAGPIEDEAAVEDAVSEPAAEAAVESPVVEEGSEPPAEDQRPVAVGPDGGTGPTVRAAPDRP